jgi:two-component system chemotaxis response regulator CheY
MLEDGDGVELLQAMAMAKFAGSVIVVSGMNAGRRIAARLPKPLDLAALRICLANLGKTARVCP